MELNIQEIIPLVEKKPVLWDARVELFKHKKETLAAWDEICLEYNKVYKNLNKVEKNKYRNLVIKKWRNVKDSWRKHLIKTIRGQKGHKKYVYDKELMFLKQGMTIKLNIKRKSVSKNLTDEESSSHSEENNSREEFTTIHQSHYYNENVTQDMDVEAKSEVEDFDKISICSSNNAKPSTREEQDLLHEIPTYSYSQSTINNPAEMQLSHLLNSAEQEDRHICFIKGVLPSLIKFDERQVLKFQLGVLQLIQNIQENI